MQMNRIISNKILKLLGERNWSVYKFSRITGLPPNTIQSIISCRYSDIKLSTLILIVNAFDMTIIQFFNEKDFS